MDIKHEEVTKAAAEFAQTASGATAGSEEIQKDVSVVNNNAEIKDQYSKNIEDLKNPQNPQNFQNTQAPQYTQFNAGYQNNSGSQPVQGGEPAKPADYVYKHSFYENTGANWNTPPQQAPGFESAPQGFPNQNIQTFTPQKEDKKKESSFRKGRLAISFACVILATSIITSAASYSIWDHYGRNQNSSSITIISKLVSCKFFANQLEQYQHHLEFTDRSAFHLCDQQKSQSLRCVYRHTSYLLQHVRTAGDRVRLRLRYHHIRRWIYFNKQPCGRWSKKHNRPDDRWKILYSQADWERF